MAGDPNDAACPGDGFLLLSEVGVADGALFVGRFELARGSLDVELKARQLPGWSRR